jgi:hypothetical protein
MKKSWIMLVPLCLVGCTRFKVGHAPSLGSEVGVLSALGDDLGALTQ